MAKKKLSAETAIRTSEIIGSATGANGDLFISENEDIKKSETTTFNMPVKGKKRIKEPGTPGRPAAGRTSVLTLKLQPEIKDYLRLRSFEMTTSDHLVSMADIVEEMLIKDMKAYYKKKERAGK